MFNSLLGSRTIIYHFMERCKMRMTDIYKFPSAINCILMNKYVDQHFDSDSSLFVIPLLSTISELLRCKLILEELDGN